MLLGAGRAPALAVSRAGSRHGARPPTAREVLVPLDCTAEQARLARQAVGQIFSAIDDALGAAVAELPSESKARVSIEAAREGIAFVRDQLVDRMLARAEDIVRRA